MRFSSSLILILVALACAGHTLAHPAVHGGKIRIQRSHRMAELEADHVNSYDLPKYEEHLGSLDCEEAKFDLDVSEELIRSGKYVIDEKRQKDKSSEEYQPQYLEDYEEEDIRLDRRSKAGLKKFGSIMKTVGKAGLSMVV